MLRALFLAADQDILIALFTMLMFLVSAFRPFRHGKAILRQNSHDTAGNDYHL